MSPRVVREMTGFLHSFSRRLRFGFGQRHLLVSCSGEGEMLKPWANPIAGELEGVKP